MRNFTILFFLVLSLLSLKLESQNAPVTTAASITNPPFGATVTVPVTVSNFVDIGAISLYLDFNLSVMTYVSAVPNALLTSMFVDGTTNPGEVRISWVNFTSGVTLPDNDTLVFLVFSYPSANTSLVWNDNGISCEYAKFDNGNYTVLNDSPTGTYYIDGFIHFLPPAVTAYQTHVIECYGGNEGELTASATGGVTSYAYTWSTNPVQTTNPATGLTVGTYTLTVTDAAGSTASVSVIVTQPDPLTVGEEGYFAPTCIGGSNGTVTVSGNGGTSPYQYFWNTVPQQTGETASGLSVGTYTVTITDTHNCTATTSATVTQPPPAPVTTVATVIGPPFGPSVSVPVTDSNFVDIGAISLYLDYNPAITTFLGASNLNPLLPGLIITEFFSGRITFSWFSLTGGNLPNGDTIADLNFAYPSDIAYLNWFDNGISCEYAKFDNGNYTVLPDCPTADFYRNGLIKPLALVTASQTRNINCFGGHDGEATASAFAGVTPYSYAWSTDPVQTTNPATGLYAGTYTVTVTDALNTTATASVVVTQPTLLVIGISNHADVSCFGGSDGSATVTASGGTPGYTYVWSTSPAQSTATAGSLAAGTYTVTVSDANLCATTSQVLITQPANLSVTTSAIHVSCFGLADGSVTASATGGTEPYQYQWNTLPVQSNFSAGGLTGGTYTVTVTDNHGCTTTAGQTVTVPIELVQLSLVSVVPLCHGESSGWAGISVNGGTTPYGYRWSTNPTQTTQQVMQLSAGTFTVTVTDAHGCSLSASVTLTEPDLLTLQLTPLPVICNGGNNGEVIAIVTGGTTPYSYHFCDNNNICVDGQTNQWSLLSAGNYFVTVTDMHGCTSAAQTTVTQQGVLTPSVTGNLMICNGTSTQLTTELYTSYIWSTAETTQFITVSPSSNSTYTVTVTDANGCKGVASATVTVFEGTAASVLSYHDISCFGGNDGMIEVTGVGGTPPYQYAWNTIPTQTTAMITGLSAGTYTVTITDANGCKASAFKTLTQPDAALTVIPSVTNVLCNGGTGCITLSVSGGTIPYSYLWNTGFTGKDMCNVTAGSYSVTVTDIKNCTQSGSGNISEPGALSVQDKKIKDVSCNGGSDGAIRLTVNGGTPLYNYQWSNGAATRNLIGITAGTYTVTVTDNNNCTITGSWTVSEPTALALVNEIKPVSCNGGNDGAIRITAGGGTPPYNYLWSNSATTRNLPGVIAGTYTVTVTDHNNCTISGSATVTEPFALSFIKNITPVSCFAGNDGAIGITVSGGTLPYGYLWNTGATTAGISGLTTGSYQVVVTDGNGCHIIVNSNVPQPQALSIQTTIKPVSCNGGSDGAIRLTIDGGTIPYSFLWSNSTTTKNITGLMAGTYTVTVTDHNNCTVSGSWSISEPGALSIFNVIKNVSCNGGSDGAIRITAGGGTPSYNYVWSNAASSRNILGIAAGSYTVTVTDNNNCTTSGTWTVTEPSSLSFLKDITPVSCNGGNDGAVSLTVSGGTPPYSYLWSNGATTADNSGLTSGSYTFTITDNNNCHTGGVANVPQPPALSILTTIKPVSCNGGSDGAIRLTIDGGTTPYSFSWSNSETTKNITGLIAGTYTVTVTDHNNCTTSGSWNVSEPTALAVQDKKIKDVSCNGGSDGTIRITVTGGTSSYNYQWSNGAATRNLIGIIAGTYTVTVTDNNNCTITGTWTVTEPTALTLVNEIKAVSCNGGTDGAIRITAGEGTPPYNYTWSNSETTRNIFGIIAGTYTVTVTDNNNCTITGSGTVTEPSALSFSKDVTPVSCFGGNDGAVSITVSGGTPPYGYLWSNGATTTGISGLTTGIYQVSVTDGNGCHILISSNVPEPQALSFQTAVRPVSCNGGSDGAIRLTVDGGTTPYSFIWNNGGTSKNITGLMAGTYTVTVTDHKNCTLSGNWTVTEPAALSILHLIKNISCNGVSDGAIRITATGGTTPYNYLWNNNATTRNIIGVIAGTYTVTVTDNNNCTITGQWDVTQPTVLTIITTVSDVRCFSEHNGAISITAVGGTAPYGYHWSNSAVTRNISSLGPGTYTVTVSDFNGCTASASESITQPTLLTASASSTDVTCYGGKNGTASVTATGGNGGYTYLWTNGGTTQTINNLTAGIYHVTVSDVKGCSATAVTSITQPDQTPVSAGPDEILCNASSTFLVGSNPSPGTGNWTAFSGPNIPVVFPPNASFAIAVGLIPGVYKFVYSVTSGQCTYSDTMIVTNLHTPTPANAGPDQQLCNLSGSDSTFLAGNVPVYGTGLWTQMVGPNTALFINPSDPATMVKNLIDGIYVFRWAISNGICDTSVSYVQVTVNTRPSAYAGPDTTICGSSAFTLVHDAAANYVLLAWTSTGTGHFNNPGSLHPTFTPSASDIAAGMVKLILSVTGFEQCGIVRDTMVLHLTPPPFADAGPDGSICEGSDFCLCGAIAYHYTSVWWTTNGCGTFNNPNILNPVYTPCPADIIAGCIKLVMHVMGNPPCGEVTDTAELCIRRVPIVYAGPDTTICSQGTYTILLSTALYQASLKWKTSGDGSFNNDTILHPTYTPGSGDLTAGHVTLTLLGIACSPCPNDSDSMVLSFSYPPLVHAFVLTHVNCYGENNGSAEVTLTGGRAPYHYLWSDAAQQTTQIATGLAAGTYTVTVTDYYNCTASSSTTITQPPLLTALTTVTHVTCYTYSNGAITLTAGGGTPAYTYRWSNGAVTKDIMGISAGTYTVTVTDSHGCTTVSINTVTQPEPWGPQICGLDTVCQGSTVQYCVCEPRRPGSTYQWTVTCGTIIDGCCGPCVTIRWDQCAQGTICVTETRHDFPYDGCQITTCRTITLKPVPSPSITGPIIVNAGQTGTVYCTPFYPGHLYSWSVIDGTVTAGQGTNCITVTWNSACSSCMGQVIAYETENGCCGTDTLNVTIIPGTGNLDGYVTYKNDYSTGLNGVAVTLRNSSGVVISTVYTGTNPSNSNLTGYYTFPGIPDGMYHITAGSNGAWGGNNATDALIIELYTVNLYPLTWLNLKVGDVNADVSVNATDALWVKLRTVGMVNSYPAGDWKFTDTTFQLAGAATVNLQGLCTGDVNGSYIPTGNKESSFLSVADDGVMTVPVNKTFDYAIRSAVSSNLGAMTLFLGYDQSRFDVDSVIASSEGLKYTIKDGQIRLAWSNTIPLTVSGNDPVLVLRMKVKEAVTVPVKIFDVKPGSEFANESAVRYDNFELRMSGIATTDNPLGFTISNFPNPFRNSTDIVYTLPEKGHVSLVLTNMFGEELRTLVNTDQSAGSYTVRIDPTENNLTPGVYLYRIKVDGETSTFVKINKMILTR